jgi:transglutaminase-like putative cysteine protease
LYKIDNTKNYRITFTHQAKVFGKGNLRTLDVYVGIPVDQLQQQILKMEFSPADPPRVKDQWSQEYAHFSYANKPSESVVTSTMTVDAKISEITYFVFPDRCGTLADIPADIRKTYTANDTKYLIDDPYIQRTAKEVVGTETNPYWMARKIFDFVRNKLEYLMVGGWNAAPVVLQRGNGSCSEYSFSFISLCRAAGLPARYVGSIVVRGDDASLDDVFHRWPEIYLPNYGWIPIDPEGGDRPLPRDRAMSVGHLSNRFLITTRCGGNSPYMGWYYNSNETWTADPQVQVNIESFGEWEPLAGVKVTGKE